jgi:nitrogen fixation protein NifU and related proteins
VDTTDLTNLYHQTIIDHSKHPRCYGAHPQASFKASGNNPMCGDAIELYGSWDEHHQLLLSFQGQGCAICMASASMMTEALTHKTAAQAKKLYQAFHDMVHDKLLDTAQLGKLITLQGVKQFPARIKCATLAWHALQALLNQSNTCVSTE